MWDFLLTIYHSVDSSPFALIWVLLLIETLFNKNLRGNQRIWWFIFIAWTHIFGAILYFILGPSQIYLNLLGKNTSQRQAGSKKASTPTFYQNTRQAIPASSIPKTSAPLPQQTSTPYPDYQQGYVAQQQSPSLLPQENSYYDPRYEQPQAIYPEMTQEQEQ